MNEAQFEAQCDCAWCGHDIESDQPFGLKTRFHKQIDFEGREVKRIPISIAHLARQIPAFVRRNRRPSSGLGHDLVFRTCSQDCARTLMETLQLEKLLFSVPRRG